MARHDWVGVKARHRLAEVAQRTGVELWAETGTVKIRCMMPDHEDRTPSMDLYLDEDRFYCHGCKAHGDQIQWVVDIYRVSKTDALTMLERPGPFGPTPGGVPVTDYHGTGGSRSARPPAERPDPARTSRERVVAAVSAAWAYYTYGALHDAGAAYLSRRGIDVRPLETAEGQPMVGHTPFQGERRLIDYLHGRGFADDELVDAGLIIRRVDQDPIDLFRRRIILPIRGDGGHVLGLIGRYDDSTRALPERGVKYLNMTRTVAYDKSSAAGLYRPTHHPVDPDGQVVICEGTLDALAISSMAAKVGLSAKFAPIAESGTAISRSQWEAILQLHLLPPVLCGDGDPTGRGASLRWATDAAILGRETCITPWPRGEDPASWLAAQGPEGLAAVTRRGCLTAPADELRPQPAASLVAHQLIHLGRRAQAAAHVEGTVERAARMVDAKDYAPIVAEAAVALAITEDGRPGRSSALDSVVSRLAAWGGRLGANARPAYCETAGQELARRDLGPDGWLVRRLRAAVDVAASAECERDGESRFISPTAERDPYAVSPCR